jgi:hypothetical protein
MDTFRRDEHTRALINTDKGALEAYKARRNRLNTIEDDINSLKTTLQTILQLLQTQDRG